MKTYEDTVMALGYCSLCPVSKFLDERLYPGIGVHIVAPNTEHKASLKEPNWLSRLT